MRTAGSRWRASPSPRGSRRRFAAGSSTVAAHAADCPHSRSGTRPHSLAIDAGGRLDAPRWLLLLCATGVGASTPSLFSSARAVWPQAVEPHLLRRGYALTSLLGDIGQVAGPTLAGLLFLISPWLAPLVCAATGLLGAALSVPTRAPARTLVPLSMPRLFASRSLLALLAISLVFGASQGIVQVAAPTDAGRWHHAALAGPILAAFAPGSPLAAPSFATTPRPHPLTAPPPSPLP